MNRPDWLIGSWDVRILTPSTKFDIEHNNPPFAHLFLRECGSAQLKSARLPERAPLWVDTVVNWSYDPTSEQLNFDHVNKELMIWQLVKEDDVMFRATYIYRFEEHKKPREVTIKFVLSKSTRKE